MSLSLLLVAAVVPGFQIQSIWVALVTAIVLGFAFAVIRPILLLLTLPVTIVTFGLFALAINVFCVWLVSAIVPGFSIDGWWTAILSTFLLWLIGLLLDRTLRDFSNEKRP